MPGTIIRAMRDAESNNPVLMIDEIDKMGADFRGDPSSAMLEVLDPEQNSTFRDHYLDLPFDLSHVFFITTANQLDPIPPALRDRMEVIELSGYTHEEKREIAKRYLVPRQMERNGVGRSKIEFTDEALDLIIDGYTREAGVRQLEREIGSICRKVAREFAEGTRRSKRVIRAKQVTELLGRRRFQPDVQRRTGEPGVATGLAWTPVGGDVLYVEATAYPGEGKLQITGQLGDVMKESASAALSYVKRNAAELDGALPEDWFRNHDLHVHVPAGAIPKDGPSAGITMATALASLVTGRPVRSDTAMTGEITLTGQVLPIGGLKEKALAAQRAGINRLIIPRRNEPDIDDIPEHLRKRMEFVPVDSVDEVLEAALDGQAGQAAPRRPPGLGRRPQARARAGGGGPQELGGKALVPGMVCRAASDPRREMAAKKRAAKAGAGAVAAGQAVRTNEYIQRLIEDDDLRDNLRTAYESARKAYARMSNGKGPVRSLTEDKKTQKELREAATSLREAADSLRGKRKKRRRGRLLLIGLVGAGLALAISEGLRKKVLDALFGAEEEFEYTATTTPEPASSEPVGTA